MPQRQSSFGASTSLASSSSSSLSASASASASALSSSAHPSRSSDQAAQGPGEGAEFKSQLDALTRMGFGPDIARRSIATSPSASFEKLVEVASGISLSAIIATESVEAQDGHNPGHQLREDHEQQQDRDREDGEQGQGGEKEETRARPKEENTGGAQEEKKEDEAKMLAVEDDEHGGAEREDDEEFGEDINDQTRPQFEMFASLLRRTAVVEIRRCDLEWRWHQESRAGAARATLFHLVDIHIKSVATSRAQKKRHQKLWPSWKRRRLGHALCRQSGALRAQGMRKHASLPLLIQVCVKAIEKSIADGGLVGRLAADSLPEEPIRVECVDCSKEDYDVHGARVHVLLLALQLLILLFDEPSTGVSKQWFGHGKQAHGERSAVLTMLVDLCSDARRSLPLVVRWLAAEALLSGISSRALLLDHSEQQALLLRGLRSWGINTGDEERPVGEVAGVPGATLSGQDAHQEWASLAFLGSISQLFQRARGESSGRNNGDQRRTKRLATSLFILPFSKNAPPQDYDNTLRTILGRVKLHSVRQASKGLDAQEIVHGVDYLSIVEGILHEVNEATLDAFHRLKTGAAPSTQASTQSKGKGLLDFAQECNRLVVPFWQMLFELVAEIFHIKSGSKFHPTASAAASKARPKEREPRVHAASVLLQATQQACAVLHVVTSRHAVARTIGRRLLPTLFSLLTPLSNACTAYNPRAFPTLNTRKCMTPTYFQDMLMLCAHLGNSLTAGPELEADEIALFPLLSSSLFNGGKLNGADGETKSRVQSWNKKLLRQMSEGKDPQSFASRTCPKRQKIGPKGLALLALVAAAKRHFFTRLNEAADFALEAIEEIQSADGRMQQREQSRKFGNAILSWVDATCGKSRQALKRTRRVSAGELPLIAALFHHCGNGAWVSAWHATQKPATDNTQIHTGPVARAIAKRAVKVRFWFREIRVRAKALSDAQRLAAETDIGNSPGKSRAMPLSDDGSATSTHLASESEETMNTETSPESEGDQVGNEEQLRRVRAARNRHVQGLQNANRKRIQDIVASLDLEDTLTGAISTVNSISEIIILRDFARRCKWLRDLSPACHSGAMNARSRLWRLKRSRLRRSQRSRVHTGIFLNKCNLDPAMWDLSQPTLDQEDANIDGLPSDLSLSGSDSSSDEDSDAEDGGDAFIDLEDAPGGKHLMKLIAQVTTFAKGRNIFLLEDEAASRAAERPLGLLMSASPLILSKILQRREERAEDRSMGLIVLHALCSFCDAKPWDRESVGCSAGSTTKGRHLPSMRVDGTDWKHNTANTRIRDGIEVLGYVRGCLCSLHSWSERFNSDGTDWGATAAAHHPLHALRGCGPNLLDMVMERYWGLMECAIRVFSRTATSQRSSRAAVKASGDSSSSSIARDCRDSPVPVYS